MLDLFYFNDKYHLSHKFHRGIIKVILVVIIVLYKTHSIPLDYMTYTFNSQNICFSDRLETMKKTTICYTIHN